jgi:hypothetical protein
MAARLKPMRETVRDELEIPLPGPGGAREKVEQGDNVTLTSDRGNSASYTLRRLKRDRRWSPTSEFPQLLFFGYLLVVA